MWFHSRIVVFSLFYRFWSHLFPFVIGECLRTVAKCNNNSNENGNDRIKQNENHFDFFAVTLPFSTNRVSVLKLNLLATRFQFAWISVFLSFSMYYVQCTFFRFYFSFDWPSAYYSNKPGNSNTKNCFTSRALRQTFFIDFDGIIKMPTKHFPTRKPNPMEYCRYSNETIKLCTWKDFHCS